MVVVRNAEALKREIQKKGYSFAAFSREIHITRSALGNIFRRRSVSAQSAKSIAEKLNSEFDEFFLIK